MCRPVCGILALFTFGVGLLSLSLVLLQSTAVIRTIRDRSQLLEDQFRIYDAWARQPLRQTHKFYFFNITNRDQFLGSDAPMTVDEIGPFVYDGPVDDSNLTAVGPDGSNVSSLSLDGLSLNLSESAGDESVSFYALNIPLIRRLSSSQVSLKISGEELVRRVTVRDILAEIVDGRDLGSSLMAGPPKSEIFKELRADDASSNYLQYLRNEMCLRLFRVVRLVNPPTTAQSERFFRKSPCDCLVVAPNGTENMTRADPKYGEVRTSKYLLRWDDEKCAESSTCDFSVPIRRDWYVSRSLFSVSSAAHFRGDDGCVRYGHQMESFNESQMIKVERFSDVVTDFSFEYQMNIPLKIRDEKIPRERVNYCPVLRTITTGVSPESVDFSIFQYIVFPEKFTNDYKKNVIICASCFLTSFVAVLFLRLHRRCTQAPA